jgi:hypothetical protein
MAEEVPPPAPPVPTEKEVESANLRVQAAGELMRVCSNSESGKEGESFKVCMYHVS